MRRPAPHVVRALRAIDVEKENNGGRIDKALDVAAGMILETGDPDHVWGTLTRVLRETGSERAEVSA